MSPIMKFKDSDVLYNVDVVTVPVPVVPQWESYIQTGRWSASSGYWAGTQYATSQPGQILLIATTGNVTYGNWTAGLRPTSMRLTFTGVPSLNVYLKNFAGGVTINTFNGVTSGQTLTVNLTQDFGRLDIQDTSFGSFQIQNIEFKF